MTIFDKAMEYARKAPIENGHYNVPEVYPSDEAAWRLHKQAMKILDMAVKYAESANTAGENALRAAVCDRVRELQQRYGEGWMLEDDGWYYRDFDKPGELMDTLIFLREMGIHYHQQDGNNIRTAVHLRISPHDYGVIFTPDTHVVMRR